MGENRSRESDGFLCGQHIGNSLVLQNLGFILLMAEIPNNHLLDVNLPGSSKGCRMDDKGCPYTIPWIQTEPLGRCWYKDIKKEIRHENQVSLVRSSTMFCTTGTGKLLGIAGGWLVG